jgi:hypothetical protein
MLDDWLHIDHAYNRSFNAFLWPAAVLPPPAGGGGFASSTFKKPPAVPILLS